MRAALVTLISILALALAGAAYACDYEQPVDVSGYGCTDNGTTVYFENLPAALEQFPNLTAGECEVPVAVVDDGPAHTYLCGSWLFSGTTPSVQLLSEAATLVGSGKYRIPVAITVAEADKQHIPAWARNPVGNDVLACDRDGLKGTGTGYNGAGGTADFYGTVAWATLIRDVASPYNRYEKWVPVS